MKKLIINVYDVVVTNNTATAITSNTNYAYSFIEFNLGIMF